MTQVTRCCMVELLFLALYLDEVLTMAEDEELDHALEALGWDSPLPRDKFMLQAFSVAREASACPIKTDEFLAARVGQIISDGEQAFAMTWLSKVLAVDGLTELEKRFLTQMEALLYPA